MSSEHTGSEAVFPWIALLAIFSAAGLANSLSPPDHWNRHRDARESLDLAQSKAVISRVDLTRDLN
jgi:hypothetical protein